MACERRHGKLRYNSPKRHRSEKKTAAYLTLRLVKTMTVANTLETVPMLVGGRWETSRSDRFGDVFNPSTWPGDRLRAAGNGRGRRPSRASAAAAFPAWAETPVVERARVMFRFRELLVAQCRRAGRARDARAWQDAGRGAGLGPARHRDGRVRLRHPQPDHGPGAAESSPAASIARRSATRWASAWGSRPFNFPAMVPLWMFPVAIACGNTFVLKPSEKVPLSAVRLGELLMEAGLPEGVFNIVHGDRECVDALLDTPAGARGLVRRLDGRRPAHLSRRARGNGKRVQAAGGAKNHLIIMPDADLDQAVGALQLSAFGCAGERCMAGSIAVPVGESPMRWSNGSAQRGRADEGRPDRRRRGGRHGAGHHPRASRRVCRLSRCRPRGRAEVALDGRTRSPARATAS